MCFVFDVGVLCCVCVVSVIAIVCVFVGEAMSYMFV